jgi:hypothetical protein
MPSFKVRDFTGGMTPDIFGHKQQQNQSTLLFNYRNWKSAATKIGGQEVELTTMPLTKPTLLDFWRQQFTVNTGYFVTAKAGNVWKTSPSGTSAEITKTGGYTNVIDGSALSNTVIWTSTQLFGGLTFVCSNENITPQYVTNNAQISPAGLLQDLPGWVWNTPGATNPYVAQTCGTIRSFDNQLWAGNITKKRQDGTLEYYPNLILYSDKSTNPANTKGGFIPDTWQPSSGTTGTASNWAGFVSLNTSDPIVDMVPLRDNLIVFTTNSCYFISKLTQTQQAINPQLFSSVRGLLSNDCAATFDGRVLFVTTDDIILTTGSSIDFQSQANQRIKDTFFNQYLTQNPVWQPNVFVRYNRFYHEVWIFYPSVNSTDGSCDQALVWDVESQGWSQVEVPGIYDAVYAPTIGDNTAGSNRPWSGLNYAFGRFHFEYLTELLVQDIGFKRQFGGSLTYQTIYQKIFDLEDVQGGEPGMIKYWQRIFPFISGDTNATIQLKYSNIPFSTGVDWTIPDYSGVFTTTQDYKIDSDGYGRYLAIRILTNDSNEHNLTSFDFDIDMAGKRG